MAAWDDRLAWKLFTGRCRYCGVECRGVTCSAHADLPRLELLPAKQHDTFRCPRCEGYDVEYHTYRGECSADPNCPHGIAVDAYCPKCDGCDIIRDSGRPSAHAAASTRRGAVLPPESDSAGSIPNGRPDNVLALLELPVQRSVGTVDDPAGDEAA